MAVCFQQGTRRAHKEHRCFFCHESITKGSLYNFRTGVNDGSLYTMHMHPECDTATAHWTEDDYECFSEGELKRGKDELR